MKKRSTLVCILLAAASYSLAAHAARYNGEDRGRPTLPAQSNAKWQTECSSCHLAYPPSMLPAASWKKLMGGLDQHFGSDASLPAADEQQIASYLTQHASSHWSASTAPLRISESGWFKSRHGELNPSVWKRASVKSRSNCQDCHGAADKGDFDEDHVRVPK